MSILNTPLKILAPNKNYSYSEDKPRYAKKVLAIGQNSNLNLKKLVNKWQEQFFVLERINALTICFNEDK